MARFSKETVVEGYYTTFWGQESIDKKAMYLGKGELNDWSQKRFHESLESTLKRVMKKEAEAKRIFFENLIPRQVYEKLLRKPNKKFRFRFAVEVEEI